MSELIHASDFIEVNDIKDLTLGEIIEKIGIKDRKVSKIEMSCRPAIKERPKEEAYFFPTYEARNHCISFELIDEEEEK